MNFPSQRGVHSRRGSDIGATDMARLIIAAMLVVALGPGLAIAQVGTIGGAPTPSPLGMTSPLGIGAPPPVAPTGIPLGATEIVPQGTSPGGRPLAFRPTTSRCVQASAARSRKPPSARQRPARLPPWEQAALLPRDWPPCLMAAPPEPRRGLARQAPTSPLPQPRRPRLPECPPAHPSAGWEFPWDPPSSEPAASVPRRST